MGSTILKLFIADVAILAPIRYIQAIFVLSMFSPPVYPSDKSCIGIAIHDQQLMPVFALERILKIPLTTPPEHNYSIVFTCDGAMRAFAITNYGDIDSLPSTKLAHSTEKSRNKIAGDSFKVPSITRGHGEIILNIPHLFEQTQETPSL